MRLSDVITMKLRSILQGVDAKKHFNKHENVSFFLFSQQIKTSLFYNCLMRENQLAVIAIVAALAMLGGVMALVANNLAIQEADAGCERGAAVNRSFERSSGRCFDRGTFQKCRTIIN